MNDINLNFLNSNKNYSVKDGSVTFNKEVDIPFTKKEKESSLEKGNFLKKIKNFFLSKKDTSSIKKLENNIIETFTFLKDNSLLPNLCPQKINFRFLRDTYAEQFEHYKEQKKDKKTINPIYDKYADSKLVDLKLDSEPIIQISTEHVRELVKLNKNLGGKFLKSLKNNFADIKEGHKIITEITILHELGHLISAQLVRNTLISRSYRKEDEEFDKLNLKNNHMQNISRNILEGFSDCFTAYITQRHYPEYKVIDRYSKSRTETSNSNSNSIAWYDINSALKTVNTVQEKDVNSLVNDFFNVAIDNAIKITKEKIANNPKLEQELKTIFDLYSQELQIIKDPSKSLIENIENQFRKICINNGINNIHQINFNIQKMRDSSLNQKNNHNNLKP